MNHEVRKTIGRMTAQPGRAATTRDARALTRDEMRRLTQSDDVAHDPQKRSACRGCGRSLGERGQWTESLGWKLCRRCSSEFVEPPERAERLAWAQVLGIPDLTDGETIEVVADIGSPWYHELQTSRADDEGNERRFRHVNAGRIRQGQFVVARLRKAAGLHESAERLPCAWCGCVLSYGPWTKSGVPRVGAMTRWPVCNACRPWFVKTRTDARNLDDARPHLLGCLMELTTGGRAVAAPRGNTDPALRGYCEVHPAGQGSEERWSYLTAEQVAAIRLAIVRDFPRVGTDAERAFVAAEKAAQAAQAAQAAAEASQRVSALG